LHYAKIVDLHGIIDDMKAKQGQIALDIIASHKAANKKLQEQVAGNLGTDVKGAAAVEKATKGLRVKLAAKRLPAN